ncbi:MAG: SpoIIE family protein phosphatase [Lentisphaeria bacterium]|nr:SpoIIE family protein phosphatase [Lentisphaeria bacterium]
MAVENEKTKVLVIDDERLIRLTLNAKLKLIGYDAVCVSSIPEAVSLLNDGGHKQFKAIITDIMMGEMDGFVFRDIVRGMDESMPIFFMTALDPEEGSGFLKRIMEDGYSFYLPKSIKPNLLLKRVQSIVDSRRVEEFIKAKDREMMASLTLAAHLQRKMLPPHVNITDIDHYTCWWKPKDIVSGDLLEVMPLPAGGNLYVLGDIQGHGTSASLAMMAVQSFLKQLPTTDGFASATPAAIANMMHRFFTETLGTLSYMTALICMHHPEERTVDWISCGAPDLQVVDPEDPSRGAGNLENRGSLPIGMVKDTVYKEEDVVHTHLSPSALCVAFTDGVFDIYRDEDCHEPISDQLLFQLHNELLQEARRKYSMVSFPYKFQLACEVHGYGVFADDVTELIFGARVHQPGILIKTIPMDSTVIDQTAQEIEQWCSAQGWDPEIITKVELVFEEKLMNLYDHGYDVSARSGEQACIKLEKNNDVVSLTVWDWGTPEPSILVAAGNPELELELKNRDFSSRGRGRLMVRKICIGIERNRFDNLNETIYHIAAEGEAETNAGIK